jgi:hypothetical protein
MHFRKSDGKEFDKTRNTRIKGAQKNSSAVGVWKEFVMNKRGDRESE